LLKKKISVAGIHEILAKAYAASTFIEVAPWRQSSAPRRELRKP
jgi:N-acetyl-gamma-glutamylphosphate reductase